MLAGSAAVIPNSMGVEWDVITRVRRKDIERRLPADVVKNMRAVAKEKVIYERQRCIARLEAILEARPPPYKRNLTSFGNKAHQWSQSGHELQPSPILDLSSDDSRKHWSKFQTAARKQSVSSGPQFCAAREALCSRSQMTAGHNLRQLTPASKGRMPSRAGINKQQYPAALEWKDVEGGMDLPHTPISHHRYMTSGMDLPHTPISHRSFDSDSVSSASAVYYQPKWSRGIGSSSSGSPSRIGTPLSEPSSTCMSSDFTPSECCLGGWWDTRSGASVMSPGMPDGRRRAKSLELPRTSSLSESPSVPATRSSRECTWVSAPSDPRNLAALRLPRSSKDIKKPMTATLSPKGILRKGSGFLSCTVKASPGTPSVSVSHALVNWQ